MAKMTALEINEYARSVQNVDSLDKTICNLLSRKDDAVPVYGHAARDAIGRNILTQFNDYELGNIILDAIIEALLARRRSIVGQNDMIEFPSEPS